MSVHIEFNGGFRENPEEEFYRDEKGNCRYRQADPDQAKVPRI